MWSILAGLFLTFVVVGLGHGYTVRSSSDAVPEIIQEGLRFEMESPSDAYLFVSCPKIQDAFRIPLATGELEENISVTDKVTYQDAESLTDALPLRDVTLVGLASLISSGYSLKSLMDLAWSPQKSLARRAVYLVSLVAVTTGGYGIGYSLALAFPMKCDLTRVRRYLRREGSVDSIKRYALSIARGAGKQCVRDYAAEIIAVWNHVGPDEWMVQKRRYQQELFVDGVGNLTELTPQQVFQKVKNILRDNQIDASFISIDPRSAALGTEEIFQSFSQYRNASYKPSAEEIMSAFDDVSECIDNRMMLTVKHCLTVERQSLDDVQVEFAKLTTKFTKNKSFARLMELQNRHFFPPIACYPLLTSILNDSGRMEDQGRNVIERLMEFED